MLLGRATLAGSEGRDGGPGAVLVARPAVGARAAVGRVAAVRVARDTVVGDGRRLAVLDRAGERDGCVAVEEDVRPNHEKER